MKVSEVLQKVYRQGACRCNEQPVRYCRYCSAKQALPLAQAQEAFIEAMRDDHSGRNHHPECPACVALRRLDELEGK